MEKEVGGPRVYLVSRSVVDWDAIERFLADEGLPPATESVRAGTDDALGVVEVAARLCYMSYGRGRRDISDFIRNLLVMRDGSVFEHVTYGFAITGVSRSLTHELVRHRAGFAYSQRSQRYVDESGCEFVVPPAIAALGGEAREAFDDMTASASTAYDRLVEALDAALPADGFARATERRKAIRQAARAALPNAAETKIFVTANVRAWRHFIEMRASPYADVEIRRLAIEILKILRVESPEMFGDFVISAADDGSPAAIAEPLYSKV